MRASDNSTRQTNVAGLNLRSLWSRCASPFRGQHPLIHLVVGATAFWLPGLLVHLLSPDEIGIINMMLMTVLMPSVVLLVLVLSWRRGFRPVPAALAMILGIWALGPSFMTASNFMMGGGLVFGPRRDAYFLLLFTLVPVYTVIMSLYDGSFIALSLVTPGLLGAGLFLRDRPKKGMHSTQHEA